MRKLICVSASALVLGGAANADFVDVAFTGAGAGQMVKIVSPGHNGDVFAGQILLSLSNSTGINLNGNWIAYCTDLYQTVTVNQVTYEVLAVQNLPMSAPMGALKAQAIADVYAVAAGNQFGSDNDFCAAFQLAIWEIVTDYTGGPATLFDVTNGAFQATMTDNSPLSAGIAGYLAALLAGVGINAQNQNLIGLGNESYQDQIIDYGTIPAPGVLATGAIGALLAHKRRRRA
jgi:hypothetical protein